MSYAKFMDRHIGVNDDDLKLMLDKIEVDSVEELISQAIPSNIRLKKALNLPKEGMSEHEFAAHIEQMAAKNKQYRSFIGMGYYSTATPAVIVRNVLQNPAWYTSYTPYQAEISQGRLEALLNFQTIVSSLTGMELANSSLLDEATATAEAVFMMFNLRSREAKKENRNVVFVDENIFPQTFDVLLTRCEPYGIEIVRDSYQTYEFSGREFGAVMQYPAADGAVRDYDDFTAAAHAVGALVTVAADLMSLAVLKAPGDWGADVVVGSTQRFGIPMAFGGPSSGYMATRDEYKRHMPGRIIGVSVDRLGNKALRMALQMREQHIKRERATSNICTAQALMATMAGFYGVYHGADGLTDIANHINSCATTTAKALEGLGYKLTNQVFFDTIEVEADVEKVRELALENQINFFYPNDSKVRFSFDEITTLDEVKTIVEIFAKAQGSKLPKKIELEQTSFPQNLSRRSSFMTEPTFEKYRSETEMMRYIKKLERRDISLAHSMIPLGSCTMKLNSASSMMPITLSGFTNIHPFIPSDQAEGTLELIDKLEKNLAIITGFSATSLQPNSGAAGEYTGMMVIRAYHQSRGQGYRNVALIPESAHGTNPATAAMAGMEIVTIKSDENGDIDIDDLRQKSQEHSNELSALMVTYPSTHGIFESEIREVVEIVHEAGGQVYMDGANMNAMVGLSSPGYIGADVCHLNLHKTFAMPHGGGGPGVGPICVAEHLAPFLPSHPIVKAAGGEEGITAVAASPYGSAMLFPITYAYIKMLGEEGLRKASEVALVNANYLVKALSDEFNTFYKGAKGRVGHELILDLQNYRQDYGVEPADIARRLMDYGFHAPTLSFPVHDTFMIEPTESESKAELDRFVEAMISIKRECEEGAKKDKENNVVVNAPHTAKEMAEEWNHPYSRQQAVYPLAWIEDNKFFPHVSKIDAGFGDRNLMPTIASLFEQE